MSNLDHTLLQIYRLLFGASSVSAHLPVVLDLVIQNTNAERGQIELYDESGNLCLQQARKDGQEIRDRRASKISGKILAWVWEQQQSILSEDARRDPRFRGSDTVFGQNVLSVICAPVCDSGGVFGVLYLDSSKREAIFNEATRAFVDELVAKLAPFLRQRMAEEARKQTMTYALRDARARELGYRELIGTSPAIQSVIKDVEFANRFEEDLLFLGESGTGKELLARLAHEMSARCQHEFVAFDCSAIPENLLSSVLFGHIKGAFTDAKQQQAGVVAEAEGGTLFLDEIGNLSLSAQALLLRFLDTKAYRMVGAGSEKKADVRLMFGTNSNLEQMVAQKTFRADLYFRLKKGVTITIPPLRERGEDIILLAETFLAQCNAQYQTRIKLGEEARACLLRYSHPGNVRSLETILREAVRAASKANELVLRPQHFPAEVTNEDGAAASSALSLTEKLSSADFYAHDLPPEFQSQGFIRGRPAEAESEISEGLTLHEQLLLDIKRAMRLPFKPALRAVAHAFERNFIIALLRQTGGKQSEAIKRAGITKSAFIAKSKRHKIKISRNQFRKEDKL